MDDLASRRDGDIGDLAFGRFTELDQGREVSAVVGPIEILDLAEQQLLELLR